MKFHSPKGPVGIAERAWYSTFLRLKEFYRVHGHSNVPQRYPNDPALGAWVGRQRGRKCRKTLTVGQRKKLSEVEFSWELQNERFDRLWNESYEELKLYKTVHGDCAVPTFYGRGQPRSLGYWVNMQKRQFHKGLLRSDRKQKLMSLGFKFEKDQRYIWRPDRDVEAVEVLWLENYDKLVDFSRTYGHTLVPNLFVNGKAECLGRWVRAQRSSYLQKTMPEHRKELLEKLGFVWVVLAKGHSKPPSGRVWNEMYARLVKYRSEHGDCQVPIDYSEDVELARWVAEQRSLLKLGSIFPFRIERLDAIGFLMTKDNFAFYWNKQFMNLVSYQKKHKTTIISHTSAGRLLRWTTAQRYMYRCGLLSKEHKELLQSIGFDWGATFRLRESPKIATWLSDDERDALSDKGSEFRGSHDRDNEIDVTDWFQLEVPVKRVNVTAPNKIAFDTGARKRRRLNLESDVGMTLGHVDFDPPQTGLFIERTEPTSSVISEHQQIRLSLCIALQPDSKPFLGESGCYKRAWA